MNMKKFLLLNLLILSLLCFTAYSQSNHTILIDGTNDFNTTNEQFTNITVADYAYFTWDANYIYFGISDPEADYGNMATFLYFDIDPTGSLGSTSAYAWDNFINVPFKADYVLVFKNGSDYIELRQYNNGTSNWDQIVSIVSNNYNSGEIQFSVAAEPEGNFREVKIRRDLLNNPNSIKICSFTEQQWGLQYRYFGWPSEGWTDGNDQIGQSQTQYFGYLIVPSVNQNNPKYLNADIKSFDGSTDNDWNTGNNWSDGISPTSSSLLIIPVDKSVTVAAAETANAFDLLILSDNVGTGSLKVDGTISVDGTFTMQRHIVAANWTTGTDGWHLLSSPVASQAFQPTFVPDPPTANEDFYLWDETTNYWINSKVGDEAPFTFNSAVFGTNFVVGQGYLASYGSTSTKEFTGTPNSSTVSDIALTYTSTSGRKGYNLLGNPYTCGIVWNVETWKPDNTTISGIAKVLSSADASYIDIEAGEIIPAMNGFFVYTTETTTLSIPATAKTHGGTWYKSQTTSQKLVLTAVDIEGETAQKSVISINPNATMSFDLLYDGEFARFYAPAFYSVMGEYKLSTNAIPHVEDNLIIPFVFEKNAGASYRIDATGVESMGIATGLLDKKTGLFTDLETNPSYEFTSEEGDDTDRFEIHFGVVGINEPGVNSTLRAYVSHGQLTILGETGELNLDILDMQGRVLERRAVQMDGSYSQPLNLPAGVYVVRVYNGQAAKSIKVILTNR